MIWWITNNKNKVYIHTHTHTLTPLQFWWRLSFLYFALIHTVRTERRSMVFFVGEANWKLICFFTPGLLSSKCVISLSIGDVLHNMHWKSLRVVENRMEPGQNRKVANWNVCFWLVTLSIATARVRRRVQAATQHSMAIDTFLYSLQCLLCACVCCWVRVVAWPL